MSVIDTPMTAATLAERLQATLDQVWAIRPDWTNPERFHEARSEAVASLKGLIAEAGRLQGSSPAVTAKAVAALRLLETSADAAIDPHSSGQPPVARSPEDRSGIFHADPGTVCTDPPATVTVPPDAAPALPEPSVDPAPEIAVPTESFSAEPTVEAPLPIEPVASALTACAELVELQRSITAAVSAMAGILGDLDNLALAARASAAVYASASALAPPPALSAAASTAPDALSAVTPVAASAATADPDTFYSRCHLQTTDGMATATALWADGVARADIGRCFGYNDHHGPACVSAAIATFLRLHCAPSETVTLASEAGKELARRTLSAIGYTPGQKLDLPVAPSARRGNGHAVPLSAPQSETPAKSRLPTVSDLPTLVPGQHRRDDLKTDRGRARAAELWLQGYGQQAISQHFGYVKHGIAYVSVAIAAFCQTYGQAHVRAYCGNKRKPSVRKALNRFRATAAPRPPHPHQSSGDAHA